MDITISDVARRVAETLTACGWVQGDYTGPDGGFCLEGAFLAVVMEDTGKYSDPVDVDWEAMPPVYVAFWERLCSLVFEECPDLGPHMFNDLDSTSLEDVQLLVKRAGEVPE